jgi:hypothetical protein
VLDSSKVYEDLASLNDILAKNGRKDDIGVKGATMGHKKSRK